MYWVEDRHVEKTDIGPYLEVKILQNINLTWVRLLGSMKRVEFLFIDSVKGR